jgi:signal transduction histidine kinase
VFSPREYRKAVGDRLDTLRQESLQICNIFTFLLGILLAVACIWSLDTGILPSQYLITSLPANIWITCAVILIGASVSWRLGKKYVTLASRLLCAALVVAASLISLISGHTETVISYLIPILFGVFLFDWREVCTWAGFCAVAALVINVHNFPGGHFSDVILLPLGSIIGITGLLLFITFNVFSTFDWYQEKFKTASQNEQIIRDDEIELTRLLKNMKEYQAYLTQSNEILVQARDEAEKALNVKQLFTQNVSHELRTPLNLIIGFSEAMINAPDNYGEVNWTPELKGDIDCIYESSKHLKALIDDVLDMAALENKKYEIFRVDIDLNSVVQEAILLTEDAFATKGLYLRSELESHPLLVHADPVRIKQVMFNLLSNALKYTRTGGVVVYTKPVNNQAQVLVQDTGKGISAEDMNKVFDSFYQADRSSNRKDTGTGLGLSISKHLIELHGGEIKMDSRLGSGTTVTFTLPLLANRLPGRRSSRKL